MIDHYKTKALSANKSTDALTLLALHFWEIRVFGGK